MRPPTPHDSEVTEDEFAKIDDDDCNGERTSHAQANGLTMQSPNCKTAGQHVAFVVEDIKRQ